LERAVGYLIAVNALENQKTLLEDIVLPIHGIFDLHRQSVRRAILNDAENLCVVKMNGWNIHVRNAANAPKLLAPAHFASSDKAKFFFGNSQSLRIAAACGYQEASCISNSLSFRVRDERQHKHTAKPNSGTAANGHNCQSVRKTGRNSPSPKININAGGIQANAKTAQANNSNSAHVLWRSSRVSGVMFEFMVRAT
jgi:hypothetical protein